MSAPPAPPIKRLIPALRTLCERPSVSGHDDELREIADHLAVLLRDLGMEVRIVQTAGAPIVLARRQGRTPRTLLLYHRYDTAPPGPWRDWSHEPFQLAERDGAVYGRGVADSKGPLAAHLAAIRALLDTEESLPCNLVIVAEGSGLIGSPFLAEALASHADLVRADLGLAGAGSRDSEGLPICHSGSKGLLQVELSVQGVRHPLPSALGATVRNPLWRLIWALNHIKGDDEDIRIPGFYDDVDGPTREENTALRKLKLDEAERLTAWGAGEFLFGMNGVALTRAEVTLPACNITSITCEPPGAMHVIPQSASALLDFQLVPHQAPEMIVALLRHYLKDRGLTDLKINYKPGGYPPAYLALEHPLVQMVADASVPVFGRPLHVAPAGPFTLPLSLLGVGEKLPIITLGVARPSSSPFGPDEHILIDDLLRHGQMLCEVMNRLAAK